MMDKKKVFYIPKSEWMVWGLIVLWSFFGERLYFDFDHKTQDWLELYFPVKIIFMLLTAFAVKCISDIVRDAEKRKRTWELVKHGAVVFIPYFVLLIVTWPGIWYGDDMRVLERASIFQVVWLQGLMATVYDMVLMMLVPVPGIVQLVHIFILSVTAGMSYQLAYACTRNRYISMLVYLPYMLPPVIYYTFYSHRSGTSGLFAYLFMILIVYTTYFRSCGHMNNILWISILAGVLPGLRTETILITVTGILAYLIKNRGGVSRRGKCILILLPLVIIGCTQLKTGQHRSTYSMAYMMNPLPIMLNDEHTVITEDDYAKISRVLDIEVIRKWKPNPIENWCWGSENAYRDGYTKDDFQELKKAFFHMVCQNPKIYLRARWQQYLAANSLSERRPFPFLLKAHHEFFKERQDHGLDEMPAYHPVWKGLRLALLNGLLLENVLPGRFFWNFLLQVLAVFATAVYGICRKDLFSSIMLSGGVLLWLCLFLMTPEANMMYYLPLYYIGNFIIVMVLLKTVKWKMVNGKGTVKNDLGKRKWDFLG